MWAKLLAAILLAEAVLCQKDDQVRRLRFRRPRPRLVDVVDPEGELEGSPVPQLIPEESAQVFSSRPSSSGSAALDALIATAQKEEPRELEIEEIPTRAPLQLQPEIDAQQEQAPQRPGGRRRVPGLPRRGGNARPRPQQDRPRGAEDEERPRGRPRGGPREEPVGTLERYSHKNEDGSFTFGYVGADGSFREETRGVDCITRGKYGYIDPEGVKREYTYTSGLPCEIGEDGEDALQNLEGNLNVDDPVDPKERFRQTQNVQLADDEIPDSARRRVRPNIRRPAAAAPADAAAAPQEAAQSSFSNFGSNSPRQQLPARRPAPSRNAGSALNNLLTIAEDGPSAVAAPAVESRPQIPQRPLRPRPAAPSNPGSFDFDTELEGFTLNRPSITFEENRAQNSAPTGTSFQSQLVFDQNTGTFQTQLKQNIPGSGQLNLQNNAAPFGVTTAAPAIDDKDFTLTARPQTTRFTPRPTSAVPAPTAAPARPVIPAGTIKLDFEPLNIPTGPIASPAPAPTATPRPAAPTPTVRLPPATPAAPATTQFVSRPAPTQAVTRLSPAPTAPTAQTQPGNTFFVFNPFNQQGQAAPSPQPASAPFQSPVNPQAFQIRPAPARPQAVQSPTQPRPVQQNFFPAPQTVPQPAPQAAPRPAAAPAPAQPPAFRAPAVPQPTPVPQAARAPAPQLQFGFQPVQQPQQLQQQQQNRAVPFTAFRTGTPPQIQALQSPQQPGAVRQLGVPPQLQGAPQQNRLVFQPGQNQLRPATFNPGQPSFSVFNNNQLRGA